MYAGVPSTAPATVSWLSGGIVVLAPMASSGSSIAEVLREPPVDHDGLAERADEHVRRA